MTAFARTVLGARRDRPEPGTAAYGFATALLFLAASALGFWRLGVPSFWLDEAVSWYNSSGSWSRLFEQVMLGNDMAGTVYAPLLKLWIAAAGVSEAALRTPSVVLMLVLLGVSMETARVLWGRRASLAAGAVTVLHPSILGSARQARGYILLLTLASLCLLGLAWQWAGRRTASRALLGTSSLLVAATHVFGVFVAAGAALASAGLAWDSADPTRPAVRARKALVALAPFLPAAVFAVAWPMALGSLVRTRLETFWIAGSILQGLPLVFVTLVLPIFVGATGVALLFDRPNGRYLAIGALLVALPIVAGPIAASVFARSGHNFATVRYMLPLATVGTVLCGGLLARLRWQLVVPTLALLAVVTGVSAVSKHQYASALRGGQEIRAASLFVRSEAKPGDEVRTVPRWEWYTASYYQVPYLPEGPDAPQQWESSPLAGTSSWTLVFNGRRSDGPPPDPQERVVRFGTMIVVQTPHGPRSPSTPLR